MISGLLQAPDASGKKLLAQGIRAVACFFILLCLIPFNTAYSSASTSIDVTTLFHKGNSWYEQQQYDSALSCYSKIADNGISSGVLFYNMGNTYFRQQKLGLAILYYEKALHLIPNDPDVIANIKFARLTAVDRTPEPDRSFLERTILRFHTLIPLNLQLWIIFSLLFLVSVFFSVGLYARHNLRLWLVYGSVLSLLFVLLLGASAGKKIYDEETKREAVVLEKVVDARNEPNGAKVLFTVHEGTKFVIQKNMNSWYLVSLPNGVSGWVEGNVLGKI